MMTLCFRRIRFVTFTLVLFGLAVAGCGDDDGATDAASEPAGTASDVEQSGAETDPMGSAGGTSGTDDGTSDALPGTSSSVVESESSLPEDGTCAADETLCVTLNIPADFAGTPDRLFVAGYASLPPMGPPDAFLPTIDNPEIVAGEAYAVRLEEIVDRGDFYLYVVIYDENGGQFTPEAGVDYVGFSDAPQTFDGGPINFPAIDMQLAGEMGGQ